MLKAKVFPGQTKNELIPVIIEIEDIDINQEILDAEFATRRWMNQEGGRGKQGDDQGQGHSQGFTQVQPQSPGQVLRGKDFGRLDGGGGGCVPTPLIQGPSFRGPDHGDVDGSGDGAGMRVPDRQTSEQWKSTFMPTINHGGGGDNTWNGTPDTGGYW